MPRGIARAAIALALAGSVLWLGLPLAASAVAGGVVSAAGLQGAEVSVSVEAWPPLRLLLLEADAVRIRSGPSTFRGARFEAMDVTLFDVGLGSPPRSLAGHLERVEFSDAAGTTFRADSVELSGSAAAPQLRVEITAPDLSSWIGRSWPSALGPIAGVALTAPDGVRISTGVGEIAARLVPTAEGGLELVVSGPGASTVRVIVFTPGPSLPMTVSGAEVEEGALVLQGTLDTGALGL